MNNYASEVKKRITELIKTRDASLIDIQMKLAESRAEVDKAKDAMDQAIFDADVKAFKKARAARDAAAEAVEMYEARYNQLQEHQIVTDADSESVIDGLLEYENDLSAKYLDDIADPIRKIMEAHQEYMDNVDETERVIKEWTNTVHANYKSYTGTIYRETGTHISPTPVPVRLTPYLGCKEAIAVGSFLNKVSFE